MLSWFACNCKVKRITLPLTLGVSVKSFKCDNGIVEIFLVLGAHWYIKGQNVLMSIISLTYFNKKEKEKKKENMAKCSQLLNIRNRAPFLSIWIFPLIK